MKVSWVQGASRGVGLAMVRALLAGGGERVVASARSAESSAELRQLAGEHPGALTLVDVDITDEASIGRCVDIIARQHDRLHRVINVAGFLHGHGLAPEKRLEQVSFELLSKTFSVNAFGPICVAKAVLPLLVHDERAVFASLSARVGSIGDNRMGGWYSYRASKAAQNMLSKTLSIELARRAKNVIVLGLHPGTVDTDLSKPFQRNVPEGGLFSPERAAQQLLSIMADAESEDSGRLFAWDGSEIPW